MSQSPALSMNSTPPNSPNPMKKKVITALVAVVIGHAGVLWAVNQMKSPELKPIEQKPLNVRFVKIQAPPPRPPEPKPEPKKEQPKPKKEVKEVKVVEKVAPPPKKVEKVQQVKKAETPKEVVKVEPQVDVKPLTTNTTITEKVAEKPKPQPAAPQPQVNREPSPKNVSIGGSGVQWSRPPSALKYTNKELRGENRTVSVSIDADESGKIINAYIKQSSGNSSLDNKILRAVRGGKFKPYKENGIAYPIRGAVQDFELTLNPNG
ncbi:energy transducer TonB [uncultured Acinetobacter sp.]|uniref:energy transducer TonB n=1 Tax=uncultured Acinetobacter sp. TaxID=165433 RepID=UPI002590BDF7|nr:energy transducer TonB [uncultured Acinetobacter sp.]